MIAASPPFLEVWFTRCFYELGSGRAPFVTHVDYDPGVAKAGQRYRRFCGGGVRLGDVVGVVGELMGRDGDAKFVCWWRVCRLWRLWR